MAIVAFFAGQRIIQATKNKSEKLPSPHQVAILVGLLDGGSGQSLIDTFQYRWTHHENLVQPVVSHPPAIKSCQRVYAHTRMRQWPLLACVFFCSARHVFSARCMLMFS
jgi:hypothetical protein